MAGKTPMEEAQVDSIYDEYKDFMAEIKPYFLIVIGMEKGDKAKLEKEVVIPARDKHVPAIEKFLAKSGSGYLVGKSVTWADLVISDSLATWETFVPSFLDGHSEVKKFVERIRELPNIKKWISERNMPQYKLTYFDIYGLGEGARLLFHQAGVKFDDNRIKREDWPALKPKTPFGQLPLLEVDGEVLAQSTAIYRYLGRQFGLAGKTPMEEAQVDSIFDVYRDLDEELRPFLYALNGEKEGDKDKLKKEVFIPAREKYFPAFEKFLAKSGSEYLVGKSLTWADIVISDAFAIWETLVPDFLSGYPELKKFVERVRELPNIKKWISERPKSLY
ncbi:unnamed protein product [Toxocara canis]|uniref:glutathione transferase n=1 Tax=Toxocara canis TaxID=6265 RepID=A0A3P7H336_TOXCA|nr:unnamed protein product [Toxocara canis]